LEKCQTLSPKSKLKGREKKERGLTVNTENILQQIGKQSQVISAIQSKIHHNNWNMKNGSSPTNTQKP
jgi:hypothetical protein